MNHKRKRPKDRRAGCLMCKSHKSNAFKDTKMAKTMQQRRVEVPDNFSENATELALDYMPDDYISELTDDLTTPLDEFEQED